MSCFNSLLILLSTIVTTLIADTTFTIEVTIAGPTIVDEFVSVTIDAGLSEHWSLFNFSSSKANTLAKGLGPAYFRYGGSHEDGTVYDTSGTITSIKQAQDQSVLNMKQFSQLADFAQRASWKFVFALNEFGERASDGTWNYTNAKDLMIKIVESKNKNLVYGFELGNEPDLKKNKPNAVSADQLAKDFEILYATIQTVWNNASQTGLIKPLIWGPDSCCGNWNYMQTFLKSSSQYQHLNGVTWHQYDCSGGTYTLQQFIDIKYMDALIGLINNTFNWIHSDYGNVLNVMGETGPANHGGAQNLTDSYVAGFFWLDKLGVASAMGIHAVCRQDFWGTNYELIYNDYTATPDYWSAYIFKNLVGNQVMLVKDELKTGRNIRTYAFCTRIADNGSVFNYVKGSVTVLILNMYNSTQSVDFSFNGGNVDTSNGFDEYVLTSYPGVINSKDIFLNGKVMKMKSDTEFPTLQPVNNKNGKVVLQPLSYGFVVIPDAKAHVCM
eukprot:297907_1